MNLPSMLTFSVENKLLYMPHSLDVKLTNLEILHYYNRLVWHKKGFIAYIFA